MNRSVQWLNVPRAAPQAGICVATWTENTFVYSWGPYRTVIPPNASNIWLRAIENVPVNPYTLACQANNKRLQLICVERRKDFERELHARILQDIRDGSDASFYDDCSLKETESD